MHILEGLTKFVIVQYHASVNLSTIAIFLCRSASNFWFVRHESDSSSRTVRAVSLPTSPPCLKSSLLWSKGRVPGVVRFRY